MHALDRFTFGPRPGDVGAVEKMGLDRWFELQLNPGKIDDSRLEGRLDEYPAARMSIAELEQRFPGPGGDPADGEREDRAAERSVGADHCRG